MACWLIETRHSWNAGSFFFFGGGFIYIFALFQTDEQQTL